MGPTERLAKYIVDTRIDDFPDEVVLKGKYCIQNAIGCALGGAQTDVGRRHTDVAKRLGGTAESTILGDGTKISCVFAAEVNADLTNVLDFDDNHWLTLSHPSGTIVGSALAVGEMTGISGKDFVTAVIVGYEVGLRIARSIRTVITGPNGKKEVMSNPSYAVFASIAAASKAMGLSTAEIVNAFGLAGSTPINRGQSRVHLSTATQPYTENKYDMGIYTLLGMVSTFRGRSIAGPANILDEDRFWTRCGAGTCNHAELTADLGKEYRIMEMGFKPVCFCGCVDAPVTAIREALRGERLAPEEIEEIKLVGVPKLLYTQWDSMVQAEFSTPCAVALAVTGYEAGPDWYTTGRYKDPDIMAIARKVSFDEDPVARDLAVDHGQWTCSVEIKTRDGKIRKAHIDHEKGTPENPLSESEMHNKFMANSRGILGQRRTEELWDALLHLEKVQKISALVANFAK